MMHLPAFKHIVAHISFDVVCGADGGESWEFVVVLGAVLLDKVANYITSWTVSW
jgi:hypothetical protein